MIAKQHKNIEENITENKSIYQRKQKHRKKKHNIKHVLSETHHKTET